MQHVQTSWLRMFNYALIGVTVVFYGTYFLFEQLGASDATKAVWGITPLVLTLGAIHAVYVLIADRLTIKRQPWLTVLVSFAIYAFLIGSVIESSGNTNILYRGLYITLIFFSGMLGLYGPLTATIFTWMILLFTISGIATPTEASLTFNLIANTLLTIAGLLGWLFFRKYYTKDKDQVILQSKLREEQFKSDVILESISDGVMIINPKGTVEILNRSTANLLGWDRQEATNLDFRSLIDTVSETDDSEADIDAISQCLDTGKAVQRVSLLKTHHEHQIYVDIVASPITQEVVDESGKKSTANVGVVAVLRDVDSQKRQEQQRSDFISTASHEMRTPVASIQGFLELALNEKVATVDDKARGYLVKAHEATKHLGGLRQDLLNVSKSDDGRLVNHPEIIDTVSFLTEIVEQNMAAASKKGLTLTFKQPEAKGKSVQPLLYINVDPERLHEVIANLIENAIKYTKKGMITVGASLGDHGVTIRVSDTGAGIATEDIPHLFQKFYRTDNSITREVGGTGLGLYIAKQIVEVMNGQIWVESTLGSGSTFNVTLPRVTAAQVEALKAKQASASTKKA